jgi:hypothetical protein
MKYNTIIHQKNLVYEKCLQTKSIENEMEYKRRRYIAKK